MVGSSPNRLVVGILEACCRQLWGFPPRMIPYILRRMGTARGLWWFIVNMPRYLSTLHALGPLRTHLACVAVSLHNGCVYCSFGHTFAIELLYFRERNRLFPLDRHVLSEWIDLEPRQLSAQLHRVLQEAGLHAEAIWVDRALALASGSIQPVDRTEARLARLVQIISRMNEVAIAYGVAPDEAHDTINKDVALKERYATVRAGVA
ncbi:hypothetical protein [Pseudonocardia sp. GCM10023141]|uniref:hypothetical protein n=1 Tax=Pseudonocardia sp. GCM10023141 TaxID=3252653 RepID=UPI00361F86AA